jgi:proline iminopeptidase
VIICEIRWWLWSTKGYRIVTYDQLGCGKSDRPKDKSLWSIRRS